MARDSLTQARLECQLVSIIVNLTNLVKFSQISQITRSQQSSKAGYGRPGGRINMSLSD